MARKAGCAVVVVSLSGASLIVALAFVFDDLFYGFVLFLLALAGGGFVQALSGRHLLTGSK